MKTEFQNRLENRFSWFDCYCECGDGWYELIYNMLNDIQEYCIREWVPAVKFLQIKEKFGTLRVYTESYCPEIDEIIGKYSSKSATICEICGANATLDVESKWMRTRCGKCIENDMPRFK